MKKLTKSKSADDEKAVSKTATKAELPKKRGRGRPLGSKNKLSADAKAFLAQHGFAGLRSLCAIAAGRPVFRPRDVHGYREKLAPDLDQMLTAQRLIVDRLVPALKATQLSGPGDGPIEISQHGNLDDRIDQARRVAFALARTLERQKAADRDAPAIPLISNGSSDEAHGGDLEAASGVPEAVVVSPPSTDGGLGAHTGPPSPGETQVLENGAMIYHDAIIRKFAIYDINGDLHSYKNRYAHAREFARRLSPPKPEVK